MELFSAAEMVIGSRFHSVILAMSFNKPVLPIVYNCKTSHYLSDIKFGGKTVLLEDMDHVSIDDMLWNFDTLYVVDSSQHRENATKQFYGLELYFSKNKR